MAKVKSGFIMMKNIDNIRSSIISMKSMGKIKSQLQRCRGLRVVSKYMNIFKCHVTMTRSEAESLFMEGQCEQGMGRKAGLAGTAG